MRKAFPLSIIIITLLLSCSKEQFNVSSLSLTSDTTVYIKADGTKVSDTTLVFKGRVHGPDDERYSFRLTSPDGDLSWEAEMLPEQELELTPGAYFPEGSYSLIVYSSNGTEYSGEVIYHGIPEYAYYTDSGLSRDSYTEEFTKNGQRVAFGRRDKGYQPSYYAETTLIKGEDGWGSTVTLTQDFI